MSEPSTDDGASAGGRPFVVVGVDGSPHSRAALRWAIAQAVRLEARVDAVLAWQLPMIGVPGAFDRDEMQRLAGRQLVEIVSAECPSPPVPLATTTAFGDATESLVEASAGAQLLVLGSRGRSPVAGLLLGSVSQGCAAAASCPVVIVKA